MTKNSYKDVHYKKVVTPIYIFTTFVALSTLNFKSHAEV